MRSWASGGGGGRIRGKQGAKLIDLAAEVGLSWRTLGRWLGERSARARFRRVQLVKPPKRELVVHGPRGVRVEGLDLEALAELLRRLEP